MLAGIKKSLSLLAAMVFFAGASSAVADDSLVGNYRGTFVGDDYGSFIVEVNLNRSITGIVHSNVSLLDMDLSGKCSCGGDCEFSTIGEEGVPFNFIGKIDLRNEFTGKWFYADHSGSGFFYAMIRKE